MEKLTPKYPGHTTPLISHELLKVAMPKIVCDCTVIKDSIKYKPLSHTCSFSAITNTPIILISGHHLLKLCDTSMFVTLLLSAFARLSTSISNRHVLSLWNDNLMDVGYRHWSWFCQCQPQTRSVGVTPHSAWLHGTQMKPRNSTAVLVLAKPQACQGCFPSLWMCPQQHATLQYIYYSCKQGLASIS